jgi:hypothetical protein
MSATISTTKKDILSRDFTRAKILHVSENGVEFPPIRWNWAELHRFFILQVPTKIILQKTKSVKLGPLLPPDAQKKRNGGWWYDTGIPNCTVGVAIQKKLLRTFTNWKTLWITG